MVAIDSQVPCIRQFAVLQTDRHTSQMLSTLSNFDRGGHGLMSHEGGRSSNVFSIFTHRQTVPATKTQRSKIFAVPDSLAVREGVQRRWVRIPAGLIPPLGRVRQAKPSPPDGLTAPSPSSRSRSPRSDTLDTTHLRSSPRALGSWLVRTLTSALQPGRNHAVEDQVCPGLAIWMHP